MINENIKNARSGTPKISVVIFSYNFDQFIGECIESVLAQTLQPYEIIICDDCSDDNSWDIIQKYKNSYPTLIKTFRHEKNMGAFFNGTFGGNSWNGDYVCLLDGDDRWLPRKLEMELKALQCIPDAQFAYSNVFTIDEHGKRNGLWSDGSGVEPHSGDILVDVLSRLMFKDRNVYRNELVSREAFYMEGHCDETLSSYWDWDREIRFAARYQAAYSGMPLVEYRQHSGGISKNGSNAHLLGMIQVYEKHLPLLEDRNDVEKAIVIISNEFVIGKMLLHFQMTEGFNYYSIENVYNRCRPLILCLHKSSLLKIYAQLTLLIAQHFRQASRHEYGKGNLKLFLKYLMQAIRFKAIMANTNRKISISRK